MKNYFGYFSLIVIMTGCIGETHCPAYREKNLHWIPYKISENLRFTDGSDTIKFLVNEAKMSEENFFPANVAGECIANAFFRTTIDSINNFKIEGESYDADSLIYMYFFSTYSHTDNTDSTLHIDPYVFEIKNNKFSIEKWNSPLIHLAKFNNGIRNYKNVLKLESDLTDKKCRIWQVYVADSVGVIQFSDRINMKTWRLVE